MSPESWWLTRFRRRQPVGALASFFDSLMRFHLWDWDPYDTDVGPAGGLVWLIDGLYRLHFWDYGTDFADDLSQPGPNDHLSPRL